MRVILVSLVAIGLCVSAWAELENVVVGGTIDIRGRWIHNTFTSTAHGDPTKIGRPTPVVRVPSTYLTGRPMDSRGLTSALSYSSQGHDWKFLESAVSINAQANMSNGVSGFIELYEYFQWGRHFRSEYLTGTDTSGSDNVNLLHAYIDANDMFGQPLRLRIGRQPLKFEKGWLVSDYLTPTQRLSFDAIRATYTLMEDFVFDAWMSKLAENSPLEEDGDVDFYGLHATYKGLEKQEFSAFWYYVRDARSITDTQYGLFGEWVEDRFGYDDYDPTNLHTIGLAASGLIGNFDYDIKGAYQFGNADAVMNYGEAAPVSRYRVLSALGKYGDDHARYDQWAFDGEVGYTLAEVPWTPRISAGAVYFGGEDHRDISFEEWLNPFRKGDASVSFSRLFSETNYTPVIQDNGGMSNFWGLRGCITVKPVKPLMILVRAHNEWAVDTFKHPVYYERNNMRYPIFSPLNFLTTESDPNLGFTLDTIVRYTYTEDLIFTLYYGHLFAGRGLSDGQFVQAFGHGFGGGQESDGADYAFIKSTLKF